MRKGQDRTGRSWLGLLGVSSFALLTGCGWFGGGGPPPGSAKLRPGADRQIQASSALPSANGQQYEQGIRPPTRRADSCRSSAPSSKEPADKRRNARRRTRNRLTRRQGARGAYGARSRREGGKGQGEGGQGRAAQWARHRNARQAGRRRTRQSGWRDEGDTGAGTRTAVQLGVASDIGAFRRNSCRRHGQLDARCHTRRDDERAGRAAASAASA